MIGQFWKIIALLLSFALRVHSDIYYSSIEVDGCFDPECRVIQVAVGNEGIFADQHMVSTKKTIYYHVGDTNSTHKFDDVSWPALTTDVPTAGVFSPGDEAPIANGMFEKHSSGRILVRGTPVYQYAGDSDEYSISTGLLDTWSPVLRDGTAYAGWTDAPTATATDAPTDSPVAATEAPVAATDAPTATAATDAPVAVPVPAPVPAPVAVPVAPVAAPVADDADDDYDEDDDEDDDGLSTELTVGIVTVGVSVGTLLGFFAVKLCSGGAVLSANQYGTGGGV